MQKEREKRSRHSDVMSDIGNMDVMLGNFPYMALKGKNYQKR